MAGAEVAATTGRRSRLPGTRGLVEGVLLIALFGLAVQPVQDPDFFWHVRVGDWIAAHGRVPTADLFSYTVAGKPWVPHEWLSELTLSLLLRHIGLPFHGSGPVGAPGLGAIVLGFGLLVFAGLVLVYRTAREVPYPIRAALMLLAVAAANPILGPRTQMVTFTLSAALLLLLRRYRETGSTRWLWAVPPLFVVWANTHAGFAIGLAFIAAHLVGEALTLPGPDGRGRAPLRPLALTLAASLLACAANPSFVAIYTYPLQTLGNDALQRLVDEWKSPDFHQAQFRAYEALALLTLALLALGPRHLNPLARTRRAFQLRPTDLILLLATFDLSLHAVRHIVLFVVVAMPVLATLLAGAHDAWRDRLPRLREPARTPLTGGINLAVVLLLGAVTAAATLPKLAQSVDGRILRATFPVATVDRLVADPPPGRVFNVFGWGGYLVYRMPDERVYIYGETELMGNDLLDEYARVVTLRPDYLAVLDRRGVDWVIYPSGAPLAVALAGNPGWAVAMDDGQAVVLVRRGPATLAYLARHGLG
ncbi:MAG TPA: hypothetical protein VG245_02395 [Candidatus Dormibacteraeota bacterium]|jgi:hypothetical protein|nr:hypothetical protein [Candidatus Dormibacteraeota bacterium]